MCYIAVLGSRKTSISETDSGIIKYEQPKPRPRPESSTGSQSNPLIAPPPAVLRRNSSASSCSTDANEPDLISFTSPPPASSALEFALNR